MRKPAECFGHLVINYGCCMLRNQNPHLLALNQVPDVVRQAMAERYHHEHQQLQASAQVLRDQGLAATALLIQGATAETIVAQAEALAVDYLVLGSHGHGPIRDSLLGSVSRDVIRSARVPVVIVPFQVGAAAQPTE